MMKRGDGLPRLFVIDDMGLGGKQGVEIFTKGSHHWNISVISLVQNLFEERRTSRVNAKYLILMKNPADMVQVTTLARQLFSNKSKYLVDSYRDACRLPHGYLLIDLSQSCDPNFRLVTGLFKDDPEQIWYKSI